MTSADETSESGLSRRGLLGGASAAAILAALGIEFTSTPSARAAGPTTAGDTVPSARAAGPTTAGDTVALAESLLGLRLGEIQASVMSEEPWHSYAYEWCAVLTSWLLRSVGAGSYLTFASDQYMAFPAVSSPAPGDIIYYPDPGHVGIVASVAGGLRTIEGNVPGVHWSLSIVKSYSPPWSGGYVFSRPPYGASTPSTSSTGEDQLFLIRKPNPAGSPTYLFALFGANFWYEWTGSGVGDLARGLMDQIAKDAISVGVTEAEWNALKAEAQRPQRVQVVS